jgi:translation initiation factor IF-3
MFRGRETTHPERGRDLLLRLAEDVKEIGAVEQPPLLDGRNMVMVLGPTKNAGVKKDAETEDTQRSEEAVQGDRDGQDPAPARAEGAQPGEEVVEAEAQLPPPSAASA